jgi:hypothetical protein
MEKTIKANSPYRDLDLQAVVDLKRRNRMAMIDAYSPAIRELIHEYGLTVVKTIHELGVTKPTQIRHIVETVLNEFSPTRGSYSIQGIRSEIDR